MLRFTESSAALLCALILSTNASAQVFSDWIGPDGGNFTSPSNWTNGIGVGYYLTLDNGNEARWNIPATYSLGLGTFIYMNGSDFTVVDEALIVGGSGNGGLGIDSGILTSTGGMVGGSTGDIGTAQLSSSSSRWNVTGTLSVGFEGQGTMNLSTGGRATATTGIVIGDESSGVGEVTLTGGSSVLESSSGIVVGSRGRGTLDISGIGVIPEPSNVVSNGASTIGEFAGSVGQAYARTAAYWLSKGEMRVASGGNALLDITGGGTVQVDNTATIGYESTGYGEVVVDGTNSLWDITSSLTIGREGFGKLDITDGGRVENTSSTLAISDQNGIAEVTVDGVGSRWVNTSSMTLSDGGTANLTISNGGNVSNTSATMALDLNSTADALVTGIGSTWTNVGLLTVGSSGNAILTVQDGGTLSSAGTNLGRFSSSTGTVTIDGAGTTWNDSDLTVVGYGNLGQGDLLITGGAQVTSNRAVVGFSGGSTGNATIDGQDSRWTVNTSTLQVGSAGSGNLNITGGGRVYAMSNVTVANGSNSAGNVNINGAGSTLTVGGNLQLNAGVGLFTIDNGGTATVAGDTTIGSGDSLTVQNGTFTTSGLTNNGNFSIQSGLVEIQGGDATLNSSLSIGNASGVEFRVLDGGDVAATFAAILGNAVDQPATAVVSGTSSDGLRRSTLRGTGGGAGADLNVGRFAEGTLHVLDGGLADFRDDLMIGDEATGQGNVYVSGVQDGFRSTIEANNGGTASDVFVGRLGTGLLDISSGALVVTSGSASVGQTSGGQGTMIIGGAAGDFEATLETGSDLQVGGSGTGLVSILEGGRADIGGDVSINTGGKLVLDGGTLTVSGDEMNVSLDGEFDFRRGTLVVEGISLVDIPGGLVIPTAGVVQLGVPMDTALRSLPGSVINVTGNSSIGLNNSFLGVELDGELNVGTNTVTLRSAGFAKLGQLTTWAGGNLNSTNGILLGAGDVLTGFGDATGSFVAASGSIIQVTGDTFLGNSARSDGFTGSGLIDIAGNFLELQDSNQAVLGSLTRLGSGTDAGDLVAANGLLVDFGNNIEGYGLITTPNDSLRPTIINGAAIGESGANPLTFNGYVKGVGTFANVVTSGTFSPGLSPAALDTGRIELTDTSTLLMELAGTTPGTGYDQLNSNDVLAIDGQLQVVLLGTFVPEFNDTFDLLTATGGILGQFDTLDLPALDAGKTWLVEQTATTLSLSVILAGDYNNDGTVTLADYTLWRNNLGAAAGTLPNDAAGGVIGTAQYNLWKANFGASIPPAAISNAVPEPSSMVVLLSVVPILLLKSRRPASLIQPERSA